MESALHTLQQQMQEAQADLGRLCSAQAELSGEIEMVSDSTENLQWGLINMGGYTNFNALTPSQRRHRYTLERANMVASRTMGMQRYMSSVRHQNRGVIHGADDTDMGQEEEESEGEELNEDNIFTP